MLGAVRLLFRVYFLPTILDSTPKGKLQVTVSHCSALCERGRSCDVVDWADWGKSLPLLWH